MKKIVNGLLYDTDKAEKIMECRSHIVYKTANGRLFITHDVLDQITCTDMDSIKTFIGENNADLYIELFGAVREA